MERSALRIARSMIGAAMISTLIIAPIIVPIIVPTANAAPLSSQRPSAAPVASVRPAPSVPAPSVPFVVSCQRSHELPDDPVMHAGHPGASHAHVFYGNRATTASADASTLAAAATTCDTAADRSAYWIPASSAGSGPTRVVAYYDGGRAASPRPWPPGLQLLGDRVRWSCGSSVLGSGWSVGVPDCPGRGPSALVEFPSCWDGRTLNGHAAVRYHDGGVCPARHRVALVRLRLLVTFPGPVRGFSSGPVSGFHADAWSFWEPGTMEELVDLCVLGRRSSSAELQRCGLTGSRAV